MVESQIIRDMISSRRDLMTSDADSRLVIVGGCCQSSYCQHWFSLVSVYVYVEFFIGHSRSRLEVFDCPITFLIFVFIYIPNKIHL